MFVIIRNLRCVRWHPCYASSTEGAPLAPAAPQNLKDMVEAERAAKAGKKLKKKKPKKPKKKKEKKGKKKKDPTADRSMESLFAELVSNGILQKCKQVGAGPAFSCFLGQWEGCPVACWVGLLCPASLRGVLQPIKCVRRRACIDVGDYLASVLRAKPLHGRAGMVPGCTEACPCCCRPSWPAPQPLHRPLLPSPRRCTSATTWGAPATWAAPWSGPTRCRTRPWRR